MTFYCGFTTGEDASLPQLVALQTNSKWRLEGLGATLDPLALTNEIGIAGSND
jgi:hypothetical protein